MSASPAVRLDQIGPEREPVVVIDGYCPDPEDWAALARTLPWHGETKHYPGVRATLPAERHGALLSPLRDILRGVFGFGDRARVTEVSFSLVTDLPETLTPFQRVPHFDGFGPRRLAALLFLSPAVQGGTAFYRHRATGYQRITESRYPEYSRAMEADAARDGPPPAAYPSDGAPWFDRLAVYEARFNRMLVYRGEALHSGLIDDTVTLSADPRVGRLTLNAFLDGD